MRFFVIALFALFALFASTGAVPMERSIDKEVLVDAPLDQVWDAWTTRAGIVSFFAPDAEIDPRVDGAFHIFINPYGAVGMKGADTMRYLALQPKSMLSFDWSAPPSQAVMREQRTVVVLRFAAVGRHTRLTLHHVGWGDPDGTDGKEWDATFHYFERAWDIVLGHLQQRFAPGGGPMDWSDWLKQLKEEEAPK